MSPSFRQGTGFLSAVLVDAEQVCRSHRATDPSSFFVPTPKQCRHFTVQCPCLETLNLKPKLLAGLFLWDFPETLLLFFFKERKKYGQKYSTECFTPLLSATLLAPLINRIWILMYGKGIRCSESKLYLSRFPIVCCDWLISSDGSTSGGLLVQENVWEIRWLLQLLPEFCLYKLS